MDESTYLTSLPHLCIISFLVMTIYPTYITCQSNCMLVQVTNSKTPSSPKKQKTTKSSSTTGPTASTLASSI